MKERRKYERFALRLPGKIEVIGSAKHEVLDVVTCDASAGGAFFDTAEPIAQGARVRLKLTLASKTLKELTGTQGLIEVGGTVVRSTPKGMAICFGEEHRIIPLRSL